MADPSSPSSAIVATPMEPHPVSSQRIFGVEGFQHNLTDEEYAWMAKVSGIAELVVALGAEANSTHLVTLYRLAQLHGGHELQGRV